MTDTTKQLISKSTNNILSILIISSLLLVTFTAAYIHTLPFHGYSVDLHSQLGITVNIIYVLIVIIYLMVFSIILLGNQNLSKNEFLSLFMSMLLFSITVSQAPQILGYVMDHRDPSSHYQSIQYISQTGHIPRLIYPLMHTHIVEVMSVTNLSGVIGYSITGISYSLTLVLFSIILSKTILNSKITPSIGLYAGFSTFPFFTYPQPNRLGYLFALIIFCLLFMNNKKMKILIPIVSVSIVFAHLLPAVLISIYLIASSLVDTYIARGKRELSIKTPISILLGSVTWIMILNILARAIIPIFRSEPSTSFVLSANLNVASHLGLNNLEIFRVITFRVGNLALYSLLAAIFFIATLYFFLFYRQLPKTKEVLFSISAPIPAFGIASVVQILTSAATVGGFRILTPIKILVPAFYSGLYYYNYKRILLIFLILTCPLAVFTLHSNSLSMQPNKYISPSDEAGVEHFMMYKEETVSHHTMSVSVMRRYGYLLDPEEREARRDELALHISNREKLPPTNNYNQVQYTDTLAENKYLIVNERDREHHAGMLNYYFYERSLFNQINSGSNINNIYTNSNVEIYKTNI